MEEWRDIQGYEGLYQISSNAEVRKIMPNGKYKILKPSIGGSGYPRVSLRKNKTSKTMLLHRLLALTFIPNPDNLPCVNHKDENKQNNRVDNLEHCTYAYNLTYGSREGEKDVPVLQYDLQGNFIKEYKSVTQAAVETNTNRRSISNATHGWAKSAGGYMWRLKGGGNIQNIEQHTENNKREVLCYDLQGNFLNEYPSMIAASKSLGLWAQDISACCRGVKNKVKDFIFKYKE